MYMVYSILVKPKYTVKDVYAINTMCQKYLCDSFEHICLTDDVSQFQGLDFCKLIDVSEYDLDRWWYKMVLFKNGICKKDTKCIFFDLDSKIIAPLNSIIKHDEMLYLATNTDKIDSQYINAAVRHQKGKHLTIANSSLMTWLGGDHEFLWNKFNSDAETYMLSYAGNDEFVTFEYDKYDLIDHKYISTSYTKNDKAIFWLR